MNMIKSIAIDMDNVIADIETHLVNLYEKEYNVKVDGSQELTHDQFSKKDRLELKTKEMSDAITMLRDDLKLLQNECAKQ